jgi:hypothetical protein
MGDRIVQVARDARPLVGDRRVRVFRAQPVEGCLAFAT